MTNYLKPFNYTGGTTVHTTSCEPCVYYDTNQALSFKTTLDHMEWSGSRRVDCVNVLMHPPHDN